MDPLLQHERRGAAFRDVDAWLALTPDPDRAAPGRLELVRQFINSADLEAGTEELGDLDALRSWLRRRGLIGSRERLEEGDLERARSVREALRRLLEDRSAGAAVNSAALGSLNSRPAAAHLRVSFDPTGRPALEPVAGRGLDRAFAVLFAAIEHAATEGSWERLKVCSDHACLWAFYDQSKNRSRSWCNMAVCGNRAKAREYRRRQRATGQPAA